MHQFNQQDLIAQIKMNYTTRLIDHLVAQYLQVIFHRQIKHSIRVKIAHYSLIIFILINAIKELLVNFLLVREQKSIL